MATASLIFPGISYSTFIDDSKSSMIIPPPPPHKNEIMDDIWKLFDNTNNVIESNGYRCNECNNGDNIEIDDDTVTCLKCGTHICYLIDCSAEYRWFGMDDRGIDPSRVGNPINPLLPESSLGTRIMSRPGDCKAMRRIRQYHLWNIMPYRERTLWTVFEGLQVRANNAGISASVIEEAKQLYAQISPLCISRGLQKDALLAACLYESLKRHDTPRRPVEIAEIFKIDVKLITRGVKQFSVLLEEYLHLNKESINVAKEPEIKAITKEEGSVCKVEVSLKTMEKTNTNTSVSFKHYLEPAIYKLQTPRALHGQIIHMASQFGDAIDELGICPETTPSSLAACTISLTCGKLGIGKSAAEISRVCSISAATLQKCIKRVESWKPVLFKNIV